jgi:hypothetical protein
MDGEILFYDGKVYVDKPTYDEVWKMYIDELKEKQEMEREIAGLLKENIRLKRLERRQQARWEKEHKKKNIKIEPATRKGTLGL